MLCHHWLCDNGPGDQNLAQGFWTPRAPPPKGGCWPASQPAAGMPANSPQQVQAPLRANINSRPAQKNGNESRKKEKEKVNQKKENAIS